MNFKHVGIISFICLISSCKERKNELLNKNYLTENELFEVEKLISEESIKNDTLFLDLVYGDSEENVIEKLENHIRLNNTYKDIFFSNNSESYYMIPFKSVEGKYKCAINYQIIDNSLKEVVLLFNFENDAIMSNLQTWVPNPIGYASKSKYDLNREDYKFYLTSIYKNSFNILDAYRKKYGVPLDVEKNIDISNLQNNKYPNWQNLELELLSNSQNIYKKIWIHNNLEIVFTCFLYSHYFVKVEYKFIPDIVKSKNKEKQQSEYNENEEHQKIIRDKERQDAEIGKNKI